MSSNTFHQFNCTTFGLPTHYQWHPIPDAAGYFVTPDGLVASLRSGSLRILKPWRTAEGYLQAKIAGRKRYVHRLVALAFIGAPPPGDVVAHHVDHRRDHNHVSNLAWITRAENNRLRLPTSSQS